MDRYNKARTICWECQKSCPGGCCWADDLQPVDGWEAEESVNPDGETQYRVIWCPEFVQDDRSNRPKDLNTDGCLKMIERLLEMTRDDYIEGNDKTQAQIERFIRGKGASKVHMLDDPEGVIENLKRASAEYRKKQEEKQEKKQAEEAQKKQNEVSQVMDRINESLAGMGYQAVGYNNTGDFLMVMIGK